MSSSGSAKHRAEEVVSEICTPEIREQLAPKKCAACGKDCVPRKGGFSKLGWFMGCPDFPKCPGKKGVISAEQRKAAGRKLRIAMLFINNFKSVAEAKKWFETALQVIEAQKS